VPGPASNQCCIRNWNGIPCRGWLLGSGMGQGGTDASGALLRAAVAGLELAIRGVHVLEAQGARHLRVIGTAQIHGDRWPRRMSERYRRRGEAAYAPATGFKDGRTGSEEAAREGRERHGGTLRDSHALLRVEGCRLQKDRLRHRTQRGLL